MQSILRKAAWLSVTLAALAASAGAASANQTFSFSGATFSTSPSGPANEGTLSGTFVTNDALSVILGYDITASSVPYFEGMEYTPMTSYISAATLPSQYFQITGNDQRELLRVYFASGLSASGGTILATDSYETERLGEVRYLRGSVVGSAVAAPGPVAGVGLPALFGIGATWFAGRRRRKAAARSA